MICSATFTGMAWHHLAGGAQLEAVCVPRTVGKGHCVQCGCRPTLRPAFDRVLLEDGARKIDSGAGESIGCGRLQRAAFPSQSPFNYISHDRRRQSLARRLDGLLASPRMIAKQAGLSSAAGAVRTECTPAGQRGRGRWKMLDAGRSQRHGENNSTVKKGARGTHEPRFGAAKMLTYCTINSRCAPLMIGHLLLRVVAHFVETLGEPA
jgi:hypothetical protein